MTLYDFIKLPAQEQYQVIWDEGVHLETKQDGLTSYLLYNVFDFYVEVEYNTRNNVIKGNTPFKYGELLEKYLPEL